MRIISIHAIAAVGLALAACDNKDKGAASEPASDTPPTDSAWPATKKTAEGAFTVTARPAEGEIVRGKHFSLDLSVEPANAGAAALAVKVDADMPAHRHGMNTQPELVPLGGQKFRVDGMLFHMSGEWVITVEVTSDGATERVSFPVQVE